MMMALKVLQHVSAVLPVTITKFKKYESNVSRCPEP